MSISVASRPDVAVGTCSRTNLTSPLTALPCKETSHSWRISPLGIHADQGDCQGYCGVQPGLLSGMMLSHIPPWEFPLGEECCLTLGQALLKGSSHPKTGNERGRPCSRREGQAEGSSQVQSALWT